jgi:hypothetical protein
MIGIVTTLEGGPLPKGAIANRLDGFDDIVELERNAETKDSALVEAILSVKNEVHNNYQDFQRFLDNGGRIGLQHDPLMYGAYTPNYHDLLTGSQPDGRAFPPNLNMTCNNWSSSNFGTAMLGHVDKTGLTDTEQAHSWNSTHQSRDCSQDGLRATGGNGLFYCFAQ